MPSSQEKTRERNRRHYARYRLDPEFRKRASERMKSWSKDNPERHQKNRQAWKTKNPGERRRIGREWAKRNYAQLMSDPRFRIRIYLRGRIYQAVKRGLGTKSARTLELLGCTIPELRVHLEARFRPGMTWENYGPVWHIDHIRPCVSFDLTDPAQQRACFHFSNTQPLFAEENFKKGSRYAG